MKLLFVGDIFGHAGRTIVAAQISFQTDDRGKAVKLVLHQNGWDMPAERID